VPRRKPLELTVTEVVPELTPEERARRIERFVDTLAKATGAKGYVGCKCVSENHVEVYVSE
jgi:polysaccharide deacetylase 2 family uncharacterized protein YibQ